MNSLLSFICAVALYVPLHAAEESVPQCVCKDIESCKNSHIQNLVPCADQCQEHAAALGANYQKLKQCILKHEPQLRAAAECTEAKHKDACAKEKGHTVPKRYPETLKITALGEINRMLSRSGVSNEVRGVVIQGKKMFQCIHSCMDKRSDECAEKLGCQLKLPSDTVLVQTAKQCVVQSGIKNAQIHEACNCAVDAGMKHLNKKICAKLTIS